MIVFKDKYEFLSIDHECKFIYKGNEYITLREAFEDSSGYSVDDYENYPGYWIIMTQPKIPLIVTHMYKAVKHKFAQNRNLRNELLAVNETIIYEDDNMFWGYYHGKGFNILGHVYDMYRSNLLLRMH